MDKTEIRSIVSRWQATLPRVLKMLYVGTNNALNKFPQCRVNFGGGNWTNVEELHVGLSEFFFDEDEQHEAATKFLGHEPNEDEAGLIIKAEGFHEIFHIFYSDWKEMENFENWWAEEFKSVCTDTKNKLQISALKKLGHSLMNSIEDGRIENLGGYAYPGVIEPLQFKNILHTSIGAPSESRYRNFSMGITVYVRLGLFPTWWTEMPPEVVNPVNKIKKDLLKIIMIDDPLKMRRLLQKMIHSIHKEIEELIKEDFENELAQQALMQFISQIMQEFKNCTNSSGGSGSPMPSGGGSGPSIHISMPAGSGDSGGDGDESGDSGEAGDDEGSDSGSSSGSGKDDQDSDKDGSGGSGDKGDKEGKDKKDGDKDGSGDGKDDKSDGSGDSKDGKDGDSKDGKSGKDGKDAKDGDGQAKDGDKDGSENGRGHKPNLKHAQRGGKEKGKDSGKKSDNNGQGTSDGNVAPDDSDETLSEINPQLLAAARARAQEISEGAHESNANDIKKAQQAEKKENQGKDVPLSKEDLSEIQSHYKGDPYAGGYKEVKVTAKLDADADIKAQGRRFRREVEKILKSQNESKIRGTSRGRLSPSQLYRMGRRDYNIFEVKNIPDKTDAVVYIVWDNSGSMWGEKQQLSTLACSVIEEGLKGLVPLAITAFCTEGNMVKHWKVKGFSEVSHSHNYAWSHGNSRNFGGGNKDGYSIRVVTKEILKRPEKQKLIIVLSDGLPSDYRDRSIAMNDVSDAVREARKHQVEVISVMFGDDNFRSEEMQNYIKMYQTGIIATSPDNLCMELIKQIRKIIFRKG